MFFLPHHLWNRYELISFTLIASDQAIGSDCSLRTIRSHTLMTSIVEEDYIAAVNLAGDVALDFSGGRGGPVVAGHIPHDWRKANFARHAQRRGATRTEWGTEETGRYADSVT